MNTFETLSHWQNRRKEMIQHGQSLGFVPTMGALHEGHLTLIREAKKHHDRVLVSIFVNPTQFNNREDLEKYPRDLDRDLRLLNEVQTDFVLLPTFEQLYQDDYNFRVLETFESGILCGAHRPGHFEGVLTVVLKLLGVARAESCYLGEKDYQQLHLIRQMAQNFYLATEIRCVPTVREPSGLAMSSRNERLSTEGRKKAALIYQTLMQSETTEAAKQTLQSAGFHVEYCEEHWGRRLVAAWLEGVRLIDNVAWVSGKVGLTK
jgi:pantoate--beta-alanine ligase